MVSSPQALIQKFSGTQPTECVWTFNTKSRSRIWKKLGKFQVTYHPLMLKIFSTGAFNCKSELQDWITCNKPKDLEVLQDHSFTWNSWAVCHASFGMDCPPRSCLKSSLRPNPLARLLDTSCSSLRRYHLKRGIRNGIIQDHNHNMSYTF